MSKKPEKEASENDEQPSQAQESKEEKKPRFLDIVFSVSAGALQGLGLGIAQKEGSRHEPNLELAGYSIDMLVLLKEKTGGNLEEEEARFLDEMLHSLRLKYLEVAKQSKEAE